MDEHILMNIYIEDEGYSYENLNTV